MFTKGYISTIAGDQPLAHLQQHPDLRQLDHSTPWIVQNMSGRHTDSL